MKSFVWSLTVFCFLGSTALAEKDARRAIRENDRDWTEAKEEYLQAAQDLYEAKLQVKHLERELENHKRTKARLDAELRDLDSQIAAKQNAKGAATISKSEKNMDYFDKMIQELYDQKKAKSDDLARLNNRIGTLEMPDGDLSKARRAVEDQGPWRGKEQEALKKLNNSAMNIHQMLLENSKRNINRGIRVGREVGLRGAQENVVNQLRDEARRKATESASERYGENLGVDREQYSLPPVGVPGITGAGNTGAGNNGTQDQITGEGNTDSNKANEMPAAPSPDKGSIQPAPPVVESACSTAIRDYFSKNPDSAAVQKFLTLQSDLTIQRLAWAYLKQAQDDQSLKTTQDSILKLIKAKYGPGNLDSDQFVGEGKMFKDTGEQEKFIQARDEFEKRPLSREALARVGPYLKDALDLQANESKKSGDMDDEALYRLADSDVKLLDIVASTDGTERDRQGKGSVLNVAIHVNSSIQGRKLDAVSIQRAKADLEAKISMLKKSLDAQAFALAKGIQECESEESRKDLMCSSGQPTTLQNLLKDCKDAMEKMYEGISLRSDNKDALSFGKVWSRVSLPKISTPALKKKTREVKSPAPSKEKMRKATPPALPILPYNPIAPQDNTRVAPRVNPPR